MASHRPHTVLRTHEVKNQPEPLEDRDLFAADAALREGLEREGAGWAAPQVAELGRLAGSASVLRLAEQANRFPPELRAFDRSGRRIDEVEYHPAYHDLMRLAVERRVHTLAWTAGRAGGHVAHAGLAYLLYQAEAGVCCPLSMSYAAIPTLRRQPELAAEWEPRILTGAYDPRSLPAASKTGALLGMAMTEKQGGSDVRASSSRAEPADGGYLLTGHKWFCSAPMSDAFLTLAWAPGGLTCVLVPRWLPDGARNRFFIQRLKDKLGNRSNASSEIEYDRTWARRVGDEGRGVATIVAMVHHTRLDCAIGSAGLMRQAFVQAAHHAGGRRAFGRLLVEQPLMRNVLADLALETEAATTLALRLSRAVDAAEVDAGQRAFARVAVAIAKYWICKRTPVVVGEALECLGGAGYVEESVLPRLYREAPLNGIWEGSGNVICLDVLRALAREPASSEVLVAELERARGADRRLDAHVARLQAELANPDGAEARARRLTEALALALEGALLVQHAPPAVADAFCAARLGDDRGHTPGTLPAGLDVGAILSRAWPEV